MNGYLKKYCFKFPENTYVCEFYELLYYHVRWKIYDIEVAWPNFVYIQIHHLKICGTKS